MGKPVQICSSDFQPGECRCWYFSYMGMLGDMLLGKFVDGKAGSNPRRLFSAGGYALVGSLRMGK